MNYKTPIAIGMALALFLSFQALSQSDEIHVIKIENAAELRDFFRYSPDRIPFIDAHRGGAREGFPENCIATFENTLKHTPAIIEVDPRLTKDSVVILMHDPTLDRTTDGSGLVADHTWEELKKLKLKDPLGDLTEYRIPTLDEALQWAKGKTILILDKKSVPVDVTARIITERKAEAYAMVISYHDDEAKRYHQINKDIQMEVFLAKPERVMAFDKSGVPWENIVASVGHARPLNKDLYRMIHERGAMCILGVYRLFDKEYLEGNTGIYNQLINEGADILHPNLAIEAGAAIRALSPEKSSKSKYFGKIKLKKQL